MGATSKQEKLIFSQRRLRLNPHVRELVRQVHLASTQMIQPLFVGEAVRERESIPGLTGTYRESADSLLRQVEQDLELGGVTKFLLFGVPQSKSHAQFDVSFTAGQIESLKKRFGDSIFLSVDTCFCSYSTHGHCGVLTEDHRHVSNEATVTELARAALIYAQAGADCIAPSDMMDGRIGAIRGALDANGYSDRLVMSYAAKFHSRFYGPFRLAADSAPKENASHLKDRATYQIDPACPSDALASSLRDAAEGADILMVKPGLPYLDVISRLTQDIDKPWAVYEVSGEFASIELMAAQGLIDGPRAHVEAWTAFARAGAEMVITYGARYAREWLKI